MQSGREDTLEERYAIRFCFKLGKSATETYGMLQTAFRPSCMNRAWVLGWHKRFKESKESVRDDERFGRSKEVRTPELIDQRVRVRVTMLRFKGSSGRDSVGRGQHSSNRVSGISTRTMHQSTTPFCFVQHFNFHFPSVNTSQIIKDTSGSVMVSKLD